MSLSDVSLRRVDTTEEAEEFMRWLGQKRSVLSFDTETTGLKWWTPNFTRLVQMGDSASGWTISVHKWWGLIQEALNKYDGPIVAHNLNFDRHALEAAGFTLPAAHLCHDTVVMHKLVNPLGMHGLKGLATKHIDPNAGVGASLLDAAKHKGGWNWATIPEEVPAYSVYGALDPVLTARLYEFLLPQVAKYSAAYDREMAAQWVLYRAERRGILIDTQRTTQTLETYRSDIEILRDKLAGHGIANPNANRQIDEALRALGWEPDEYTKTGLPKLDKKVLGGLDFEVAELLLDYKQRNKWKKAYLETFLREQDEDGRCHPSVNTMQAITGRMSITGIALQTLPKRKDIRDCILPYEGDQMWAIDYSSQELRLFAHFADEGGLKRAIATGQDPHTYTASEVYGIPYDEVPKEQRSLAKNVRYCQIYGGGDDKIAATAGVDVSFVKEFRARSAAAFPKIDRFISDMERIGKNHLAETGRAYIETWGGREVVADPDAVFRLVNYRIQGTAADILKEKIIHLDNAGYGDNIILPVHDELLFSFPPGQEGADMAADCAEIMSVPDTFSVPLTCDVSGPFERWGDGYAY